MHSYEYGVEEPPMYPEGSNARELADALDRIMKLPDEFWTDQLPIAWNRYQGCTADGTWIR